MEEQNNYAFQNEPNSSNYYSQRDTNYNIKKEKNTTNKAKEMIKNFDGQYLENNNNSQKVLAKGVNQMSKNCQPYQLLPIPDKTREDFNSYDYYNGSNMGNNRNITQTKNKFGNERVKHNIDINQENAKLKKQVMDLVSENKNLQKKNL